MRILFLSYTLFETTIRKDKIKYTSLSEKRKEQPDESEKGFHTKQRWIVHKEKLTIIIL